MRGRHPYLCIPHPCTGGDGHIRGQRGQCRRTAVMMTVGIMVAQSDLRELVTDKKQLVLSAIRLLVIPAICIPLMKLLPVDPVSYGIFILLMAMPVGSVVMMVEKEYGTTDGSISAKSIALTSVLSVVTIPLVTYLA